MNYINSKLLRNIYLWGWVRPSQLVQLVRHPEFYTSPTYYPEYPERLRSHVSQFFNQVGEILRFGRINTLYFLCGYDVKTRKEQKEYVHYNTFMYRRVELNLMHKDSSACILRDKMLFSIFLEGLGLKGPNIQYYYDDGQLFRFADKSVADVASFLHDNRVLFCKPLDGQCGKGIFVLEVKDGRLFVGEEEITFEQLSERMAGRYIFQDFVKQHPAMAHLHPQSINTIRLLTVRSLKDNEIHFMPSILRIGTGASVVDNTTQGGLAIGIHLDNGYLKHYGFFKPRFGTKVESHPDSHVKFDEFQIPFFEEAKQQAKLIHSMLPDIHSIGWDIAIGEDGPLFIEGNDNWEITGPQTCNGGFRKYFTEYFFK